jgi:hypothetical protein
MNRPRLQKLWMWFWYGLQGYGVPHWEGNELVFPDTEATMDK